MPILGSIIKSAIELGSKLPVENYRKLSPIKLQEKTLLKMLKKAQNTAFGEAYDFENLIREKDPITAFKKKVPLFDYNSIHKAWWYRTLNGESYVCWPGKVKYFALSSGTSEASSKYLPVTADLLKAIKKTSTRQIFSLAKYNLPQEFYQKGILMMGGSTHLEFNGTYYEGDLSGITTGNIPFWFQHFYKPGKRISRERNWTTKLDEIVANAGNWDIGVIVGVPAWMQILMERIIKEYNLNTIHDIWPNLSIYVHGGVSFTPYVKSFEKLLAHPITYIETYLASEGFMAYQTRPNANAMQLVLDNGLFFEFVPFTEDNFDADNNLKPNANALTIGDVEEGVDYALLITSVAGAYRYLIGDTIRFTSKELSEIVITGRTKHFLSICGEHLSQENMNRAIEMLSQQLNVSIPEFCVAGMEYKGMFAHQWYIGSNDNINIEQARKLIDDNLKLLNDDYRVERLHAVKDVFVKVLPVEVFYNYMRKCGKEGGQNKFTRVLKNAKLSDWTEYLKTIGK
jgi:hypothetical protein